MFNVEHNKENIVVWSRFATNTETKSAMSVLPVTVEKQNPLITVR